jgi:hypothetical protein
VDVAGCRGRWNVRSSPIWRVDRFCQSHSPGISGGSGSSDRAESDDLFGRICRTGHLRVRICELSSCWSQGCPSWCLEGGERRALKTWAGPGHLAMAVMVSQALVLPRFEGGGPVRWSRNLQLSGLPPVGHRASLGRREALRPLVVSVDVMLAILAFRHSCLAQLDVSVHGRAIAVVLVPARAAEWMVAARMSRSQLLTSEVSCHCRRQHADARLGWRMRLSEALALAR